MYNLDSDEIQGNYALMLRAAQQEALSPSSPTIGAGQTAICLLQFRIKASNPNVPPLQPIKRDGDSAGAAARNAVESGKYRIACHALIIDSDAGSIGQSGLEHSSHCLPSPFAKSSITKNDYILLARRFPIYVGDYIEPSGQTAGDGVSKIQLEPGMSIRVWDNDVQGGVYGTITEVLDTERAITQLPDGTIRALFNGGEGGLDGSSGDLHDPVLEQYRILRNPEDWPRSQISEDPPRPWSSLDVAEEMHGPGQRRVSQGPVSDEIPPPELEEGWSLVQRWRNLIQGDSNDYTDDILGNDIRGHSYVVFKEGAKVTVYESAQSYGFRTPTIVWEDIGDRHRGYTVAVQSMPGKSCNGCAPPDFAKVIGSGKFRTWVDGARLPCVTFTACFLLETWNPDVVDLDQQED